MKNLKMLSISSFLGACILIGISFLIPIAKGIPGGLIGSRVITVIYMILASLYVGAAMLFLAGLKEFSAQLKLAYTIICVGIIFLGVANIQLPLFQIFNVWDNLWVTWGGISLTYFVAVFLIYFGLRHFARLLHIKSKLTSLWMMFGLLVLICLPFLLIPKPLTIVSDSSRFIYSGATILNVANTFFMTLSAILIFIIKGKAGPSFTNVLAWFFVAQVVGSIAISQAILFQFIGFDNAWVTSGCFFLIFIGHGILIQKAGYAFNRFFNSNDWFM